MQVCWQTLLAWHFCSELGTYSDDDCAAHAQAHVHGDMLGAILRSARPQAGVLAATIQHHVTYTCRTISAPAAATASAAVQHRPATHLAHQLTADAPRSATNAEDAWPAAQHSSEALPANTATRADESAGQPRPSAKDLRAVSGTFIRDLRIRDFALVEDQLIHLAPGLNVITGESGAGKSVLVEAFASILGAPAPDDCVRPPAQGAVVEGTVQLSPAALVRITALKILWPGSLASMLSDLRSLPGHLQRVLWAT